jgi:hypothetical protein
VPPLDFDFDLDIVAVPSFGAEALACVHRLRNTSRLSSSAALAADAACNAASTRNSSLQSATDLLVADPKNRAVMAQVLVLVIFPKERKSR